MKQKLKITALLLLILSVLGITSLRNYEQRKKLVFAEALDTVAVTVDGQALTLGELAFYIAYEEGKMEQAARIYNRENTDAYWRIYTNRTFFRQEGKQAALEMAIHDEIFYRLALAEDIKLSEEEEAHLANDQYDFWSDLEEEQRKKLGISRAELDAGMYKAALAEKYQYLLAEIKQREFEEYSFQGQAYKLMLEQHTCVVEEAVWERVPFGSITVNH